MAGEHRVAWSEGMFLRPQHFQQQDRHVEAWVRARVGALSPFPWGLTALEIDADLAAIGKFGVRRAAGVLPDGAPFDIPGDMEPPPPLDIPDTVRESVVHLTLPPAQTGVVAFSNGSGESATRFKIHENETTDAYSGLRGEEPIEVGALNLQFGVLEGQTHGRVTLGLAKIEEVRERQVIFDKSYIPPCLAVGADVRLRGVVDDIWGRTDSRVEELAVRAAESTEGGAGTFSDFLLLQYLNGRQARLDHLRRLTTLHPERLYAELVEMAGELATFTQAERRAPPFPVYDHENLQGCFDPVVRLLQSALAAEFQRTAVKQDLEEKQPGVYVAPITDRELYRTGAFYLAVSARRTPDSVQAQFPLQVKIGSVNRMPEIVQNALPGVPIHAVTTPPSQLRTLSDFIYFELDRTAPDWADFRAAPALGLHVAGDWPELKLELWAIRRTGR